MSVTQVVALEWQCDKCQCTAQTSVGTIVPVGWVGFARDDQSHAHLCRDCRDLLRSAAELMESVARNLGIPVELAVEGIARSRP